MSTYSQNLFAVLSESGDVRPEPVAAPKEEKKVEPKSDKKRSAKSAAGGDEDELSLEYKATTDKDTVINL
ncbi:hypothetical protein INT48_008692, partial [Thamnidium elegans]